MINAGNTGICTNVSLSGMRSGWICPTRSAVDKASPRMLSWQGAVGFRWCLREAVAGEAAWRSWAVLRSWRHAERGARPPC